VFSAKKRYSRPETRNIFLVGGISVDDVAPVDQEAEVSQKKNLIRGVLAGVAGGLAASWLMNEFMAAPGSRLRRPVRSEEERRSGNTHANDVKDAKEDTTTKTADTIVERTNGGQPLSLQEKQKAGPVIPYAVGAVIGGVYGGLAEYSSAITSGFGTSFGSSLYGAADVLPVPALSLPLSPGERRATARISPFAAHAVYGVTTELVRRIVRAIL
jgi:putative membrane protein